MRISPLKMSDPVCIRPVCFVLLAPLLTSEGRGVMDLYTNALHRLSLSLVVLRILQFDEQAECL